MINKFSCSFDVPERYKHREKIFVWNHAENTSISLEYQLLEPGRELLEPVTTKSSRPGQPPPLTVRTAPPSPPSSSFSPTGKFSAPQRNDPKTRGLSAACGLFTEHTWTDKWAAGAEQNRDACVCG